MGTSADEIARQIAGTRDGMENRIVELRERGEVVVQRSRRALITGAIIGGAVVAAVALGVVAWRVWRPPTTRERFERLLPKKWLLRLGHLRASWEYGVRRQVPAIRLFVGERQIGEEPPSTHWEKIGMRFAQAAGGALGAALVSQIMTRLQGGGADRSGER